MEAFKHPAEVWIVHLKASSEEAPPTGGGEGAMRATGRRGRQPLRISGHIFGAL